MQFKRKRDSHGILLPASQTTIWTKVGVIIGVVGVLITVIKGFISLEHRITYLETRPPIAIEQPQPVPTPSADKACQDCVEQVRLTNLRLERFENEVRRLKQDSGDRSYFFKELSPFNALKGYTLSTNESYGKVVPRQHEKEDGKQKGTN